MHDGFAGLYRPPGTAVDPSGGSIGEEDVGGTSLSGSDRCRFDRPPPLEFTSAGVVAIGPYEKVDAFEREQEGGPHIVGVPAIYLGDTESGGIDTEFDDDAFPTRPRAMESVDRCFRFRKRRVIDKDKRRPFPRLGNGCVGIDHNGSTQYLGNSHDGEVRASL
jgi:hypothetical protein